MVDKIRFKGNISGIRSNNQVKHKNTIATGLNNFWVGYFNSKTTLNNITDTQNTTLEQMKNRFSPAVYNKLLEANENFASVNDVVMRNTKQENLVINNQDYIQDREYADAEV